MEYKDYLVLLVQQVLEVQQDHLALLVLLDLQGNLEAMDRLAHLEYGV